MTADKYISILHDYWCFPKRFLMIYMELPNENCLHITSDCIFSYFNFWQTETITTLLSDISEVWHIEPDIEHGWFPSKQGGKN